MADARWDVGRQTPLSGMRLEDVVDEDGTERNGVSVNWTAGQMMPVWLERCWISYCGASVEPESIGLCEKHLADGRNGLLGSAWVPPPQKSAMSDLPTPDLPHAYETDSDHFPGETPVDWWTFPW